MRLLGVCWVLVQGVWERDLVPRQILNGGERFHSAQRGSELLGPSASVGDDFRGARSSDDHRRVQIPTWAVSVSRAPATAEHGGRFAIFAMICGSGRSILRSNSRPCVRMQTGCCWRTLDLRCHHLAVLLVMVIWRTQKASIGLWESPEDVAPTVMDADIEVPPPRPDVLRGMVVASSTSALQ